MDYIPKELAENQLRLEVAIDPATKCMTMKTLIDDKSELVELMATEVVPDDPLLQSRTDQVDWEKMSELDQLIFLERRRLLNLKLPKKIEKSCKAGDILSDWDGDEADSNHQLTQNEKSRLRKRKLRERESAEEHEYRKFRGRVQTLKARLLHKLRNFEDETYLIEVNKRASDRVRQKRLELKATETPAQEALRKRQVNLARRRRFLRNKAFSTAEDFLHEKERRIRYLKKSYVRRTEEQHTAKRKHANEKAKQRRRQNNKEWEAIQKAVKGQIMEDVKV